jgi:arginyl-tRNA--protein-N-Asp/Glu arginylyltransferase
MRGIKQVGSAYDQECAREFAFLRARMEQYFYDVTVECPYNLPYPATFHQGASGPISDRAMELFLAAGFRRNGNFLYAMRCADCAACVPIRLQVADFVPNRSQRRVMKYNEDVDISIGRIAPTREHLALCDKFLKRRFPHRNNTAQGYYSGFFLNTVTATFDFRYRFEGRLIGNGIVDIGDNFLNAVYFFFDPDESRRSLGTFNILTMIDFCRQKKIEYLYLGYFIENVGAMNYKKRFRPHYVFVDSQWQRRG